MRHRNRAEWIGLLALAAWLLPLRAEAVDGVIEIDHDAIISSTTGYPFLITAPGSYVLTSDRSVPDETNSIEVHAHDVRTDLNGFAVRGTHVCEPGSCSLGKGKGVSVPTNARFTTLVNGQVSAFGDACIELGSGSALDHVLVKSCAGNCVTIHEGGQVLHSRLRACGAAALETFGGSVFAENVIRLTGLATASDPVLGNFRGPGNLCDEAPCETSRRRFYLTTGTKPVGGARNAAGIA